MQIRQLAQRTGLPPSAIRYYESIDLLPSPTRQPNGYRFYREADVDRLRLVAGLRALDFSIDDVAEVLALRDRGEAPCRVVLELLAHKADEIQRRVAELERLETELRQLHRLGLTFPTDDVDGKNCICHLVSQQAGSQQVGKEKV